MAKEEETKPKSDKKEEKKEKGRRQPTQGKSKDLWYLHCPILGVASDEEGTLVACGGGGHMASKEVPNIIEAYRVENGALAAFATVDTEKELCTGVIYVPELRWWVCNVIASVRIYTIEDDEFILKLKFVAETDQTKEGGAWLNVTHMVDYNIATGGSDGIVRRWTIANESSAVAGPKYEADAGEIKDVCFSASMEVLASCHTDDKTIRIWDLAKDAVRHTISWPSFGPRIVRWVDDDLLVLASGPRGPAKLRIYEVKDEVVSKKEVLVDAKPASSLTMAQAGDMMVIGLTTGGKKILSYPQLSVMKKTGELHDMPISSTCFLHPDTPVSGSGDYALHRGPLARAGSGKDRFVFLLFLGILIGLLYNLAMKMGQVADLSGRQDIPEF